MSTRTMKETGVSWIGAIPAGWDVRRFKRFAVVRDGQVDPRDLRFSSLPLYAPNHIESQTGRLLDVTSAEDQGAESGKYRVKRGDIIYSKIRPSLAKVCIAPTDGLCSADMYAIYVKRNVAPRFLMWAMLDRGFTYAATLDSERVAMPKINRECLAEIPLPYPPLAEQQRIAAFLDARTATIDAAIAEHQRTLDLLAKRRQSLLSHAVTRGLDPDAPVRDSGVAWIGEIPRHWQVVRIVRVARLESGHTPSRQVGDYWKPEECVFPWFSLADVWQLRDGRREYLGDTAEKISAAGLANSSARLLPAGTVILSRTASVGFSGIMPRPMATTQDFANWVCSAVLLPEYLLFVLRSMRHEFEHMTQGSTHQTIYMPDLKKLTIPLPPLDEQRAIVVHLRERTAVIDEATRTADRAIELLREYRQSLITAAVTGRVPMEEPTP